MKEIILLKSGEIALKGLNRSTFEDIMAKNARRRLQPLGEFKIWHAQSTTYVQPLTEGVDMDEAVRRLQTVFGIVAVTKSCVVEKDFSVICPAAAEYCFPSHASYERGYALAARELGLSPWLLLDMRLGEGSGCPLAFQVMAAACAAMNGMATFEDAAINDGYLEEIRAKDSFTV